MKREFSIEHRQKISEARKRQPKLPMPEGMTKRKDHIWIGETECKECSRCKKVQPLTQYGKDRNAKWDGLAYYCKACVSLERKKYYQNHKHEDKTYAVDRRRAAKMAMVEYKGNKCEHCGIEHVAGYNTSIFQFHHKDPSQKDFAISQINMRSLERIKPEVDKCLLLCANCHHILHWKLKEEV